MPPEFKRTIALGEIPGRYEPLTLALGKEGLSGDQIDELLRNSVSLRCMQCGATVGGADFIALGLPRLDTIGESAELQRLQQKHCLTENCPSNFYHLRLAPVEGVDWEAIWTAAERIRKESRLRAEGGKRNWLADVVEQQGAWPLAAAGLLLVAIASLLYSHLRTPSWAKPAEVYRGDTNSIGAPPPTPDSLPGPAKSKTPP
jgi:hypothetical protein